METEMENSRYFVNSRGILKSCNFHSTNPQSSCNNDTHYLNEVEHKMFDGMSIYVCSDLVNYFVNETLPKINKKFVLVSGDSDMCVPEESLSPDNLMKLINSPYLINWFAQNNTAIQHIDKIIQLPIGLDYHTISNDPHHYWKLPYENNLPKSQETILMNVIENSKPFHERIPKIYVNFSIQNDKFKQREKSLQVIPTELCAINQIFTPRTINWNHLSKYAFVLSPFGMGMDCHRTWEALCLGSIPIVKASNFAEMFSDLPVLIVNDWSEISQELLDNTLTNFKNNVFNYDKLKLNYWVDKIKSNGN